MAKKLLLGCIADDFTGASDAASFLVKGGFQTVLCNGVPDKTFDPDDDIEAIVIALKIRTVPVLDAISDSLYALQWFKDHGARQIYFKYCSTFDSTPQGNIGPVSDALLEALQVPYTILCPAMPVNKRTILNGCLLIDGIPLQESSMKNHPLTPMWDCRIGILMASQGKYDTLEIHREELYQSNEKIAEKITKFSQSRKYFYIVPDYFDIVDSRRIIELFGDWPLLTGGSGLMEDLARKHSGQINNSNILSSSTDGPAVILAGSCSKATLEQIKYYQHNGGLSVKIDPDAIMSGKQTLDTLINFMDKHLGQDILFYCSEEQDRVRRSQKMYGMGISEILEQMIACLAYEANIRGYNRIIIAGGETSGAVAKTLDYRIYHIGRSVAPGVPVMAPLNNQKIRIIMKSGNFGQPDFFVKALDQTKMNL